MAKFPDRLISLRKERDMTQEDLARLIQKKRSTVSGYETEGKEPDLETICFLAQYFGVSTDYLLGHSDERNNVEQVFFNDHVNFEKHYWAMPFELRPAVSGCFDSFYLLLNRDMQLGRSSRLLVYQELFQRLQALRAEVRKTVEASGGSISDPIILTSLMNQQNQLKHEVAALLDKLMQSDIEIEAKSRKGASDEYVSASAV